MEGSDFLCKNYFGIGMLCRKKIQARDFIKTLSVRTRSMIAEKIKPRPHLVPANLVGQRFARNVFGETKIALIGYCPPPSMLEKYNPIPTHDQYFIHVSPDSVKRLSCQGTQFLSLVHIYGGPVSASTVEELAYYDFDYILAYGLAGGLGTKNLRMGDFYLVDRVLVADGTTPHYTKNPVIASDRSLKAKIMELVRETDLQKILPVQAITGDAIYREDYKFLNSAREKGCDIVNLDSSHLFAVSKLNSDKKIIKTIECGVISDVTGGSAHQEWESRLSVMLASQSSGGLNPLELTGKIVEFYLERLAPVLVR
jgi:uridine phosphorylase